MIYKLIKQDEFGTVFARIDDDGLCRVTCVAENTEFQAHLKNGGQLEDADGNLMTAKAAKAYVATLP
jgi:hypothetical protein